MDRGEIYDAELDAPGTVPGHEQIGYRPVLIISPAAYNIRSLFVVIVPFTKTQKLGSLPHTITVEPSVQNGLDVRSILLVLQIRALDKRRIRLDKYRGIISPEILVNAMRMIEEMI